MEFVKSLGKGSCGSVKLIRHTEPDGSKPYYRAVKSSYGHEYESLYSEFQILSKLKDCPRIVQTFGTSLSRGVDNNGNSVYNMSMEYAACGSLTSFMEERSLTDTMIRDFTRMILEGLVSVHDLGYVHCDLKPDNVLVFPREDDDVMKEVSYELKISDFGMSTEAGEESVFWDSDSPFLGTPIYMSPESVQDGVAETSLDLWSLGCVVLEMYTGESPWPFEDPDKLLRHLLDEKAPEITESIPCEARQFLETCFARNPVERGSALDLLKHPFLLEGVSDQEKKVMVTGTGGRRKSVAVLKSKDIMKKPLRVKINLPKPPQFKKIANRPLKLNTIAPKPPGCNLVFVQSFCLSVSVCSVVLLLGGRLCRPR